MAVPYNGDLTNIGYGKEYSGTGQVESLMPSADKAYSDSMQQTIIEERNALKISVESRYGYLLGKYSEQIRRYNHENSGLFPYEKLIVESLKQLSTLIKYNTFNPRNNFRLQELIINNIYLYEKQKKY
jgi:hypothetical protein